MELTPEDRFFVLACDGVWDVMTNQAVVDFVSARLDAGERPAAIAAALLDACLAPDPRETRGIGCDNMTATIVLLHGTAGAAAAGGARGRGGPPAQAGAPPAAPVS